MKRRFRYFLGSGALLMVFLTLFSVAPFTRQFQAEASPVLAATKPTPPATTAAPAVQQPVYTQTTAQSCTTSATGQACDLYATTGTISLPGQAASLTFWGYSDSPTGAATLPGPTIVATQGVTLTITLHNNLTQNSGLAFPNLSRVEDIQGAAAASSKTYSFVPGAPGSSLYEASLTPGGKKQVAMGMYGAIIVRPAAGSTPGTAYGTAATAFNDEAALVFSEIDPGLLTNPGGYDLHTYAPKYWLINGQVYPSTPKVMSVPGHTILLHYLNAGIRDHSIGTLGLAQPYPLVIGLDGKALAYPYKMAAETVPAGASLDVLATVPSNAPAGMQYPVYDAARHLDNNGILYSTSSTSAVKYGGMLTFIGVPGTAGATNLPTITTISVSPTPSDGSVSLAVTANLTSSTTVSAAEYFIDSLGADGTGKPLTKVTNTSWNTSLTVAALSNLSNGTHAIYIHAKNSNGWGAVNSATFQLNKTGALVTGILNPAVTNGSVDVTIQAQGDTRSTSNLNITAAEYYIDTDPGKGNGVAIPVTAPAPVVSLVGTIPAATVNARTEGVHTVYVRAKDSGNVWGSAAGFTLTVDKTGPATSAVTAGPSPNNGTVMFDPNSPFKVTATVSDSLSNVVAVEAFVDNVTANGTGHMMIPTSGNFNLTSASFYYVIQLSDISQLGQGLHKVYVHGQDAAGNWGAATSQSFIVDKTPPTLNSLSGVRNTNAKATLTLNATDPANTAIAPATVSAPASAIVAAEYFEGTDPGAGKGKALTLTGTAPNFTATVTNLTSGSHTLKVRVKDAAGNWSAIKTVTV